MSFQNIRFGLIVAKKKRKKRKVTQLPKIMLVKTYLTQRKSEKEFHIFIIR